MYNPYNGQMYMNDLQQMRDRIDRQMQMQMNNQQNQPTPITQNFQLAPNQTSTGIKYANNVDDVKKELVFMDTLFVNKEFSTLWFKNASGDIKTYDLKEVIELDERDVEIQNLKFEIEQLKKERLNNEQYVNENANGTTSSKKSTSSRTNSTSHE